MCNDLRLRVFTAEESDGPGSHCRCEAWLFIIRLAIYQIIISRKFTPLFRCPWQRRMAAAWANWNLGGLLTAA
jgi:hypothetical protein